MSMPRAVRHINESRILSSLFRNGGMSRASLARELDLTRSTVGNLVNAFVKSGYLVEDQEPADPDHRAGRPGLRVDLNPDHATFIGLDVAADRMMLVLLDLKAEVAMRRSERLPANPGSPDAIVDRIAAFLNRVIAELPCGAERLRGVCVTVPGTVDRSGVVFRVPMFAWRDVPLATMLRERLSWDGPLIFENDANAFAFAELYRSKTKPLAGALCLYMDIGIGGGVVSEGKLVYGARGFAGEVGYIHVGDASYSRPGQMPGSFESYVGREAVTARWREKGGAGADFEDFVAAAEAGEAIARATLDEWAFMLGRGIATLTSVLDPERIILGGPVARVFPLAEHAVNRSVVEHLLPTHPIPLLERTTLDETASALGGACMLHRTFMSIDGSLVFNGLDDL